MLQKLGLTILILFSTVDSFGQCESEFDKLEINYTYNILNARREYIIKRDVIQIVNTNDSLVGLRSVLTPLFDLCLDSINHNYICYDDGIITQFVFYNKGDEVKLSYLSGDMDSPLLDIIKIVNGTLPGSDKIPITLCPEWPGEGYRIWKEEIKN